MEFATATITFVLVVITGYYAWQNHKMVTEMRLAREASLCPHLELCFEFRGSLYAMVGIANVGPGTAVSLDVTVEFHPREGSQFNGETRRWRRELLAAGAQRNLSPPHLNGSIMPIQQLADNVDRIAMTGSMRDVTGKAHEVSCEIAGIDEWVALLTDAHERLDEPPLKSLVKEMKNVSKTLDKFTR